MLQLKYKCPRHPRYDPNRDFESGIRGGCVVCLKLLQIARAAREIWRGEG